VLPDLHLRTTNEMLTEFKFLNDQKIIDDVVINNGYLLSNEIANNIQPLRSKLYSPKIDDVENKLTDVVYTNARKLYGSTLPPTVEQRIKHELKAIVDNNYSVIY
jgi:DNA polymerase-3 subunit alpha (Gram-positive type)